MRVSLCQGKQEHVLLNDAERENNIGIVEVSLE